MAKDQLAAGALAQVDSFLRRIEHEIDVNHHDMGYLYSLSCVSADYRLPAESASAVLGRGDCSAYHIYYFNPDTG